MRSPTIRRENRIPYVPDQLDKMKDFGMVKILIAEF